MVIICRGYTFTRSKPVYVDINLNDFNMDIKEIEKKLPKKLKQFYLSLYLVTLVK